MTREVFTRRFFALLGLEERSKSKTQGILAAHRLVCLAGRLDRPVHRRLGRVCRHHGNIVARPFVFVKDATGRITGAQPQLCAGTPAMKPYD